MFSDVKMKCKSIQQEQEKGNLETLRSVYKFISNNFKSR